MRHPAFVLAVLFTIPACKDAESHRPVRETMSDERVCESRRVSIKNELEGHRTRLADLKKQLVTAQKVAEAARAAKDDVKATQADVRTQEVTLRINEEEKLGQTIEERKKKTDEECKGK